MSDDFTTGLKIDQLSTDEQPAPPPTIRGVQLTQSHGTGVVLDWLSFTLPNTERVWFNVRSTFGAFDGRETRVYGYQFSAEILETGRVFWSDDRPEMGIHFRLPATALTNWEHGVWLLLKIVLGNDGHFTRVDIAFDDFQGLIDPGVILEHWQSGETVTRYRTVTPYYKPIELGQREPILTGVTVGNRQSASYLRIYDKRLEQQKKGVLDLPDNWVRVEIETKDEKATEMVKAMLEHSEPGQRAKYLAGVLVGLFDVVVNPGTDSNKSRWPRAVWWAKFLANVEKVRIGLPKVEKTLDQVKAWWKTSIAPMMAVLLLADHGKNYTGYDWLMEVVSYGEQRFKKRHKVLCGIG